MIERKLFLQIQSIKIMYPNEKIMMVVPIKKRTMIIKSIHVCVISPMNFNYEENGGKKAPLANPKHQYHAS